MASFNRIIMAGNLTRDPELKQLPSGISLCKMTIASTNRQFKNKQTGALEKEVCFIDVDVWGAQAESCNQYLKKGRPVLVEGRLKLDTWKDAEGQQQRSKHSIVADRVVFLGSAPTAESDVNTDDSEAITPSRRGTTAMSSPKMAEAPAPAAGAGALFKDEPPFEDDLPF